jgi:hypothetical protein
LKKYIYHQCIHHIEKPVMITTYEKEIYIGIIRSVDSENVYLQPVKEPMEEAEDRFFPLLGAGLIGLGLGTIAGVTLFRPYPYPYPYPYGYGYGW